MTVEEFVQNLTDKYQGYQRPDDQGENLDPEIVKLEYKALDRPEDQRDTIPDSEKSLREKLGITLY